VKRLPQPSAMNMAVLSDRLSGAPGAPLAKEARPRAEGQYK